MLFRTDTTPATALKTADVEGPERLETTGELQLVCIVCRQQLPDSRTVLCWAIGGTFVVACIECAP